MMLWRVARLSRGGGCGTRERQRLGRDRGQRRPRRRRAGPRRRDSGRDRLKAPSGLGRGRDQTENALASFAMPGHDQAAEAQQQHQERRQQRYLLHPGDPILAIGS